MDTTLTTRVVPLGEVNDYADTSAFHLNRALFGSTSSHTKDEVPQANAVGASDMKGQKKGDGTVTARVTKTVLNLNSHHSSRGRQTTESASSKCQIVVAST
eukprot:4944311-Amphidinium_carterae.1